MQLNVSYEQAELLIKTVANVLDSAYTDDLFRLYLRLLLQAKDEGLDITQLGSEE